MSTLNHFMLSALIVPSAEAAAMASSNIFFRSVSSLRMPTPMPGPKGPPRRVGPASFISFISGLAIVAVRTVMFAKTASMRPATRSRSCCSVVLYSRISTSPLRY